MEGGREERGEVRRGERKREGGGERGRGRGREEKGREREKEREIIAVKLNMNTPYTCVNYMFGCVTFLEYVEITLTSLSTQDIP